MTLSEDFVTFFFPCVVFGGSLGFDLEMCHVSYVGSSADFRKAGKNMFIFTGASASKVSILVYMALGR